jgi:hypothetical protein
LSGSKPKAPGSAGGYLPWCQAVECAVADCLEPDVAGRVVAIEDVVGAVAIEIAHAGNGIVGVGAADLMPFDGDEDAAAR